MIKSFCDRCGNLIGNKSGEVKIIIGIFTMNNNVLSADLCYKCAVDLLQLLREFSDVFKKEIK